MGSSPGEPRHFEVERAITLYQEIEAYGLTQVMTLRHLELSPEEGERLMELLGCLQQEIPARRLAWQRQNP